MWFKFNISNRTMQNYNWIDDVFTYLSRYQCVSVHIYVFVCVCEFLKDCGCICARLNVDENAGVCDSIWIWGEKAPQSSPDTVHDSMIRKLLFNCYFMHGQTDCDW